METWLIEGDYSQISTNIRQGVKTILEAGAVPVVLGGDHSISYPLGSGGSGDVRPAGHPSLRCSSRSV